MEALKCDRCGAFYNNYADLVGNKSDDDTDIINVIRPITEYSAGCRSYRTSGHTLLDLCPKCASEFCAWMHWYDRLAQYVPLLVTEENKESIKKEDVQNDNEADIDA